MQNAAAPAKQLEGTICDHVLISLRKIIQSIDINSRSLVKRVGLTGPQLVILQQVSRAGEASVGEIAKAGSLSQATVTGILERLEKRGFVVRRRSERDRRRVMVTSTEAGARLLETAPSPMQESFIEQFGRIPDWEQTMILSALQRLVVLMDAKQIQAAPMLTTGPIDGTPAAVSMEPAPPLS